MHLPKKTIKFKNIILSILLVFVILLLLSQLGDKLSTSKNSANTTSYKFEVKLSKNEILDQNIEFS